MTTVNTPTTPTGTPNAAQQHRAKIAQALDTLRKANALHMTGSTEAAIDMEREARVILAGLLQDADDGTARLALEASKGSIPNPTHQDTAAQQHAHNALSMAAWHCARGEAPQALARIRRAKSHIMNSMGVAQ